MVTQEANRTLHTDSPDLPECFQLSVLSWLPCLYLWAVSPLYLLYLKKNNKGYIMMSILNRVKTVRRGGLRWPCDTVAGRSTVLSREVWFPWWTVWTFCECIFVFNLSLSLS